VVKNTPGVTGFVGAGTKPVPLSQGEVDRILRTGAATGERVADLERAAQPLDVLVFRRRQGSEGHVLALEHPVREEGVKVGMNQERAGEVLDEDDRAGERPDEAEPPRAQALEREDGADESAEHLAEQLLVLQQRDPKPAGEREGPLTPGDARQHVVHQVRRAERRPSRGA